MQEIPAHARRHSPREARTDVRAGGRAAVHLRVALPDRVDAGELADVGHEAVLARGDLAKVPAVDGDPGAARRAASNSFGCPPRKSTVRMLAFRLRVGSS